MCGILRHPPSRQASQTDVPSKKYNKSLHDSGAVVLCSQHAHLDHRNCMENIIVRGKVEKIRALHQRLSAIKGIKHVVLSMTTTGEEL